jgi:exodeoxyribonuclease III
MSSVSLAKGAKLTSGKFVKGSERARAKNLLATGDPVVLAGDYNVMPTDLDVYAPERWVDDALFRPEVRDAYRRLVEQGWTDALRALHPGERIYTFWKYFRNAFARDAGLRIDHLLLSPPLAKTSHFSRRGPKTCAAASARAIMPPPGSHLQNRRRLYRAGRGARGGEF